MLRVEIFCGCGCGMGQLAFIAGGMADMEDEAVIFRAEHTRICSQKRSAAQGVEHILGGDKLRCEQGIGAETAQIFPGADGFCCAAGGA